MDATLFHKIADELLQNLADEIENANDRAEVDYLQGILTITLPNNKQFVLNKHEPTKQIWLSSPISGSHKFTYTESSGAWVGYEKEEFFSLIEKEILG
jgi:CyaY protein